MLEDYEHFSEEQEALLDHFVTNTKSSIFVLRNLPEVIKGALFSRYSRSTLGLRTLLLREFIQNSEEAGFSFKPQQEPGKKGGTTSQDELLAIKKAQNFYDRILDGYGDDSIGELGGAHLAIENISMLAAKAIEDCRIGGSPLEKSTRYIYFDQKVHGEYLFYKEPILMTSAWRDLYISTCTMLFETYSKLIPPLTAFMEERFPKEENVSKSAYIAAIRAKTLDCLRGLLPASTLTNMGLFGNGRFFEGLLHKLNRNTLVELQEIGKSAHEELSKVIPSFVRRGDVHHKHHISYALYTDAVEHEIALFSKEVILYNSGDREATESICGSKNPDVRLVSSDPNMVEEIATALLYESTALPWQSIQACVTSMSSDDIGRLFESISNIRAHRRHKSPRGLEHGFMTFEILADFGVFRDLQRHRILTQERQGLTAEYGYYMPTELVDAGLHHEYQKAMDEAKLAYDTIAASLPEEAQYIVPMAYNMRWYQKINIRGLQWLTELRSQSAGHPTYRYIAQEMARLAIEKEPLLEKFLRFVDYEGHDIGRLDQEIRSEQKRSQTL
ncbi:MAG: FAD-dependent thymidylate synthase [Chlamydia sp.]